MMEFIRLKFFLFTLNNERIWKIVSYCCKAVFAVTRNPRWKSYLGNSCYRAGLYERSAKHYEECIQLIITTKNHKYYNKLQPLKYNLDKVKFELGDGDCIDPLYICDISERSQNLGLKINKITHKVSGRFSAEIHYGGMIVYGIIFDRTINSVKIYINGLILRETDVSSSLFAKKFFMYKIKKTTLASFPKQSSLTVETIHRNNLSTINGMTALIVTIPHGDNSLITSLLDGNKLTKKGVLSPASLTTISNIQDRYVQLYDDARRALDQVLGRQLFVFYGTLLGLYRDGDLIDGDDDFDVGFFSIGNNAEEVKDDIFQIILQLVKLGFSVTFNRRGRLFRIYHEKYGGKDVHLDVSPVWEEEGRIWAHNQYSVVGSKKDFLPVQEKNLRNNKAYIPNNSEKFFTENYGIDWKTPNPGFRYYPDSIKSWQRENLDKANITFEEYLTIKKTIDELRENDPMVGNFFAEGFEEVNSTFGY